MIETFGPKTAKLRILGLNLEAEFSRFPVDRGAGLEQWRAYSQIQRELFEMRVDLIARMQEITGSQYWRSFR